MRSWRVHIRPLSGLAAVIFAVAMGLPRAGLYTHEHSGGDHVHVHAEDHAAHAGHSHPHQNLPFAHDDDEIDLDAGAAGASHSPAWRSTPQSDAAHTHWQHVFQLAAVRGAAIIQVGWQVEPLAAGARLAGISSDQRTLSARGPPHPLRG